MPIDFSKFGQFADTIKQKVEFALANDGKVSENEIEQMKLEKEAEKMLRQELRMNRDIYDENYVITKKDNEAKYKLSLNHKSITEGKVDLGADTVKYYAKKYPDANIASSFLKSGILFLTTAEGKIAKDENGKPITVKFSQDKQEPGKINLVQMFLDKCNKNGSFDIKQLNNLQKIQDQINSHPEVTESYLELMQSIEFEQMSDDEKADAILENTLMRMKYDLAKAPDLMTAAALVCQITDVEIGLDKVREFLNKNVFHYGAEGLRGAASLADSGLESIGLEDYAVMKKGADYVVGGTKGVEKFVLSTQMVGFAAILAAASETAAIAGVGEAFAILTTGYFAADAANMGYEGFKAAMAATTPEEREAAGEILGQAGFMMLGIAKGAKSIAKKMNANTAELTFEDLKAALDNAKTREELIEAGNAIKEAILTPEQRLEANAQFFKKTVELRNAETPEARGIVNMHLKETPEELTASKNYQEILAEAVKDCGEPKVDENLLFGNKEVYTDSFGNVRAVVRKNRNGTIRGMEIAEYSSPNARPQVTEYGKIGRSIDRVSQKELKEFEAGLTQDIYDALGENKSIVDQYVKMVKEYKESGEKDQNKLNEIKDFAQKNNNILSWYKNMLDERSKMVKQYSTYPDGMRALLDFPDRDIYGTEIADLAMYMELYPEACTRLLNIKGTEKTMHRYKDDNQWHYYEDNYKFDAKTIPFLIETETKFPGVIEKIVNDPVFKDLDCNPLPSYNIFNYITEIYNKEPQLVRDIYAQRNSNRIPFANLCQAALENPEGVRKMINDPNFSKYKWSTRGDEWNTSLVQVVEAYNKHAEMFNDFALEVENTPNGFRYDYKRWSVEQIPDLIEAHNINPEITNTLRYSRELIKDGSFSTSWTINNFVKNTKDCSKSALHLLKSDRQIELSKIEQLAPLMEKNFDKAVELFEAENPNACGNFVYEINDLVELLNNVKDSPEILDLFTAKDKNGQYLFRYSYGSWNDMPLWKIKETFNGKVDKVLQLAQKIENPTLKQIAEILDIAEAK